MRDRLWVVLCVVVLFAALFFPVLFRSHQFIYRDAGHFYYPYFQFIQQEWDAGRFPLWNPFENSGSPLLANPTSSVLYPGKLVFFLPISYASAYKGYIMLHVLLCAATAGWMARHAGASVLAAGVCGMSYAFSGPVLLQHANVVFLVGAAWAPAAVVFADRVVRLGKVGGAVGLGVVLALQVLGGDPEIAYLCGVLAAVYAGCLYLAERRGRRASPTARQDAGESVGSGPATSRRSRRLILLTSAAGIAVVLSLVQVLPTWQFKRHSTRAFTPLPRSVYEMPAAWLGLRTLPEGYRWYDGLLGAGPPGPHNTYDFSTEPWRWVEMLWPNATGRTTSFNTRWDLGLPGNQPIWTPTLYCGLLPLVLAFGALGWLRTSPLGRGFAAMIVFGLVASLGKFGLVWLGRVFFGEGLLDLTSAGHVRVVGDEVGGLYWLMTVLLPEFAEFRYPSKLLVFSALGISGLAAVGWDCVTAGGDRGAQRLLWLFTGLSAALLAASLAGAGWLEQRMMALAPGARDVYDGPLDVPATVRCIQGAFLHSTVIAILGSTLLVLWRRRPGLSWTPAVLAALVAVDLGVANYWLIATGPQSLFKSTPHALKVIHDAEMAAGTTGEPFRVFRPALFQPLAWSNVVSETRAEEGIRWERDSLVPKYGLPYGVEDASVLGTMGLYDYDYFFGPWTERVDPAQRQANPKLPERVVRYAPRPFDFWNVKYFVLPYFVVPADEYRGIGSLLVDPENPTEKLPVLFEPPDGQEAMIDYQVVLNPDHYPRAWVVHEVTAIEPIRGFEKRDRDRVIGRLMLDATLDPRREALVETNRPDDLEAIEQPGGMGGSSALGPAEPCEFIERTPNRVKLRVRAAATGLLVLADTFYPGWEVSLDGEPAEILRTNRMMRGVVVPAGEHTVTFRYRPKLVYASAAVSAVGWSLLVLFCIAALYSRRCRASA